MGNQNRLKYLHKIHNGTCTKCKEAVGMLCVLQYEGYKQDKTGKGLIGPKGNKIKQATVEHIIPRSNGGTNDWGNLTLLCADCNNENNKIFAERHEKIKQRGRYLSLLLKKYILLFSWLFIACLSIVTLEKELAFVFNILFSTQIIILTKINNRFL